jgi:plastocyanin
MTGNRLRLALVVALTACAIVLVPSASQGSTATVKATGSSPNFKWMPGTLKVAKGTTVTWKNKTTSHHSVTAYGGGWTKSTTIQPGKSTSFTFKKAGTYLYYCHFHSTVSNGQCSGTMCAKVKVTR